MYPIKQPPGKCNPNVELFGCPFPKPPPLPVMNPRNVAPIEAVPSSCIRFDDENPGGPVQSQIDLEQLKTASRVNLEQSLSQVMKPGVAGLREYMSSVRNFASTTAVSQSEVFNQENPHLDKFIDHFVLCDGMKYFGIMEQIEYDYDERCRAYASGTQDNKNPEAVKLRKKLNDIVDVQPVSHRQNLKNFNFPELLQKQVQIMDIDYKSRIFKMNQIHQYGIEITDFWLGELHRGTPVDPVEVHSKVTQILAELLCQAFSLLTKMYEMLMVINQDDQVRKYMRTFNAACLTQLFSEFRRLLVDEVSAVGESFAQVIVRIPELSEHGVVEVMTQIYNQINFVDICISKALRPAIPMILLFENSRATLIQERKNSIMEA